MRKILALLSLLLVATMAHAQAIVPTDMGQLKPSQTSTCLFRSFRQDTGASATLTAGAVKVYKDADNTSEVTTGLTFTGDFDSITGLNAVAVDTSNAFYAAGHDYHVVVTTGTVNSVSVTGSVVCRFSISNQYDNLGYINAGATTGNNATLKLAALDITNSGGTAVVMKSTGGNGRGLEITGNGNQGLYVTSSGGSAMKIEAGNQLGLEILGSSGNPAVTIKAVTAGTAMLIQGLKNGDGVDILGGDGNGTTGGAGLFIAGGAADVANPAGPAMFLSGGSSSGTAGGEAGPGLQVIGGDGAAANTVAGRAIEAYSGVNNGAGGANSIMVLDASGTTPPWWGSPTGGGNVSALKLIPNGTGNGVSGTLTLTKNTAFTAFPFVMFNSTTGLPMGGLTVSCTVSLDGGAFAACANSPAGISSGAYKVNLAAADMNGNSVILKFTATGARATIIPIITQP